MPKDNRFKSLRNSVRIKSSRRSVADRRSKGNNIVEKHREEFLNKERLYLYNLHNALAFFEDLLNIAETSSKVPEDVLLMRHSFEV